MREIDLKKMKDEIINAIIEETADNPSIAEKINEKIGKIFEKNTVLTEENPYEAENQSDDLKNSVNEVEAFMSKLNSGTKTSSETMYTIPEELTNEEPKKKTTRKPRTKKVAT